ncbi:HNH endonuclease family protein [Streptomyces sp. NPDC048659]|uniref:HNH endonuclease family protein n=1 Tax=Streptomyces sp. NPDC048659 TaxID=3155489 RepID=UPI00341A6C27
MTLSRGRIASATSLFVLSAVLCPAAVPAAAAEPAAVAAPAAAAGPLAARVLPEPPGADQVRAELDRLTIEAPHSMSGYSRDRFPHWIKQYGECDTREVVLSRDGQGVTQDSACRAIEGTWTSLYDDKVIDTATKIDIDHIVPLANAWRSGADSWTTDKRKRFANDLDNPQLIAVSAASNRSKGDQSPDQWAPPSVDYWCTYSRAWTHIKSLYGLSITQPEKDKIIKMLDNCA